MPDVSEDLPALDVGKAEIICPLGFTVQVTTAPRLFDDCGHACCYPGACERLRRLGIQLCEANNGPA
jgi:hypothetical protein